MVAIDWNVVKTDYLIHSELSLSGLAKKFGISYQTVREVATRERWEEQRRVRGAQIQRKALALAEHDQVVALAQFDADMLHQADQIRELISVALMNHHKPHELRQLQAASEGVLRMGHLCLGGATTNMQALPACDVDAARERLFNDMLAAQDTEDTPPSGDKDESLEQVAQ